MATITVYSPDGEAWQKEPVDARELCETCGWTMEPKDEEVPAEVPKKVKK